LSFFSIAQEGEKHVQGRLWHKDGSHSHATTGLQQVASEERTSSTSREENKVQQEIIHLNNLLFQYNEKQGQDKMKWKFLYQLIIGRDCLVAKECNRADLCHSTGAV